MNARKFFSKIGMAYFVMAAVYIGAQTLISLIVLAAAPQLLDISLVYYTLMLAPLYALAIPLCVFMLKKLPRVHLYKNKLGARRWIKLFFICVFIMYAGNIIGELVCMLISYGTGLELANSVSETLTNETLLSSVIFSAVLAPIFEELIFRKALIDRTAVFGDKTAMVLSALIFGLFHGNLYQFFYAFGLGLVLSYIYIRTGKIRCCITMHMAINLFCGILPAFFLQYAGVVYTLMYNFGDFFGYQLSVTSIIILAAMIVYAICLIVFFILGIVKLIKSRKTIDLRKGEYSMPFWKTAGCLLGNAGMWLFFAACAGMFAISIL